jgi:hypothetical protein
LRLRFTACISCRPPHYAMTCFCQVIDPPHETHGPNERKRANVGLRKLLLQAQRGGEKRSPFGDHIVHQQDLVNRRQRALHYERLVVFAYRRALAGTRGSRSGHRRLATQPLPDQPAETNFPQREGQLRGWPVRALSNGASGNGYQYAVTAEQIRKLRVAKARPIHNARVAGKPLRVTCLQPFAQLTGRVTHSPGGTRRIDIARTEHEAP